MMKLSFTPEHPDYTNLKHMSVNLEFPTATGDESPLEMLMMFKQFLKLMNYSDYDISKLVYNDFCNKLPNDDDDILRREDDGFTTEEIQELNDMGVEVRDIEEVEEIVAENEEHRS